MIRISVDPGHSPLRKATMSQLHEAARTAFRHATTSAPTTRTVEAFGFITEQTADAPSDFFSEDEIAKRDAPITSGGGGPIDMIVLGWGRSLPEIVKWALEVARLGITITPTPTATLRKAQAQHDARMELNPRARPREQAAIDRMEHRELIERIGGTKTDIA